jgi:glyoxylase-like metal-dependent hydrolase (beta-lactamase superfamily II)
VIRSGFRGVRLAGGLLALGVAALACFTAGAVRAAEITAVEIRDGVYLFQGAGSNVVALADGDDLLIIDGGLRENSADLLAAIRAATGGRRIDTLINTHWHPEQVGLNELAAADGAAIIAHEQTRMYLSHAITSPLFDGSFGPLDERAQPNVYEDAGGELRFAGHRLEYGYLPAAHTNGDLYVLFPELDVLLAGGAVGSDSWPLLDYWNGGFIGGLVRAHENLAALVNDETIVVPADGPAFTGKELQQHRDMYQQLFRDLSYLMNQGMGYNDVVKINPLRDHESRFGDPSRFLDGAYRSKLMTYVPN